MHGEMAQTLGVITVILVAALLAPLISYQVTRWIVIPGVVLEISFGILIGPPGLGLIEENMIITVLAELGLALLMFMAGYEINFRRVQGTPLRLATLGWMCSLTLGLSFSFVLWGWSTTTLVVGLALTTTALGTLLPILRDSGATATPFGARVMATGAVGEFGPILVVALLLSGERPALKSLFLLLFLAVAALAAWRATKPRSDMLARLIRATLGTSAQLAVRMTMLTLIAMVWLATVLGLDVLLGAFAAGIIIRLLVTTNTPNEASVVESKLEALGFGLFIPLFFIVTGMRFDLDALLAQPSALLLVPAFLAMMLLVRGAPVLLLHRRDLARGDRQALGLFTTTALPLVVVITTVGTESGALSPAVASALVAAGMASVVFLPLLALHRRGAGDLASQGAPPPRVPQR